MTHKTEKSDADKIVKESLSCGIIMPISSIDGMPAEHWADVKTIIQDSIESIAEPKFRARLVSDADDVGVIQKRIVQGVYESDAVVCDVSGRNANVMFELGMRLAFDKPTVIIKDDKTEYSFDTSIIEHIPYPRDLRFAKIVSFKNQLAAKVFATYKASIENSDHSTFLKNFGTFKVAKIEEKVGSPDQLIIENLKDMQYEINKLRADINSRYASSMRFAASRPVFTERGDVVVENVQKNDLVAAIMDRLTKQILEYPNVALKPTEELLQELKKYYPVEHFFSTNEEFMRFLEMACRELNINYGRR